MNLPETPIEPARLNDAARRALAPGPARMMAARGLAPLPQPGDLVTVLYQLALDPDAAIRETASQTARGLPDRILDGALADEAVDPRVLDYFSALVADRPALVSRLLLNQTTADETVAAVVARADEAVVDLCAQNEARLLRHPAIISAMYHNPRARMSTVDRAVELAVRNGVKAPGIPAWDDLIAALRGAIRDPNAGRPANEADARFARAARIATRADNPRDASAADADDADADVEETLDIRNMSVPMKIRLATLGNSFIRSLLIRDPIRAVAVAAIKAPGVTDMEAAKYAGNQALSDDVIAHIAGRRDWTKLYAIKLALVQNPKAPIAAAIRLMPHIRERDLRSIARSKNIPSAVTAQARKLLMARTQGGRKR